jgi:putative Holliday junction resolvase
VDDRVPAHGRLAALDFGTVRIGVAVTDPEQRFASPLEIHQRGSPQADSRWLTELVRRESLCGFVVGLPIHTDGRESAKSQEARHFAVWLREITGLPVQLYDERFTTVEADAFMVSTRTTRKKQKQRRDKLAAQILLTAFLESTRDSASDARSLDG